MTDCLNEEMRDLLPMLAHGALDAPAATLLRAHLASCAACRAELEVIGHAARMLDAVTPSLDLAAIVAALPAPRLQVMPGSPAKSAAPAARRARWVPRQYIAAAASVLIVASLASPLLRRAFDGPDLASAPDTGLVTVAASGRTSATPPAVSVPATASAPVGLTLEGGLSELSDDDLAALLAELEQFEATVMLEPSVLRSPIISGPGGV